MNAEAKGQLYDILIAFQGSRRWITITRATGEMGSAGECVHQKMMKDAAWDARTWETRDVP